MCIEIGSSSWTDHYVSFLKTTTMFNVWPGAMTLKNNDAILMPKGAYVPPIMTIIAKAVQPVWYLQWTRGPKGHISCTWVQCATIMADWPGWPSCFSVRPEKHKLGRGRWDLASCQVSLNSVQRFQRRSRKCLGQSEARVAILFFRSARKTQTW